MNIINLMNPPYNDIKYKLISNYLKHTHIHYNYTLQFILPDITFVIFTHSNNYI